MAKENEKVKDNDGKKNVNEGVGSGNIDNVMDMINNDYVPEDEKKKPSIKNKIFGNIGGSISSKKDDEE